MASLPMPAWSEQTLRFPQPTPVREAAMAPATLTALEWSVVAMAEKDGLSSLRDRGRFLSALGSLFGARRPRGLANERLEALRRLAVHAWVYRWNVPNSELRDFLAAGFTQDHYQLVQNSIGQARTRRAAERRRVAR